MLNENECVLKGHSVDTISTHLIENNFVNTTFPLSTQLFFFSDCLKFN